MSYEGEKNKISRIPITLAVITLDFCGRSFGVSPCLATGEPCYNTFSTCKYLTAFLKSSKDYKFSSAASAVPFPGPRPYLKEVKYLPTEIKDNLTINARTFMYFYDEPDGDVGIDPYVTQRASVQGTFWKKLLARNPNYKGRVCKIYEGFLGLVEGDFVQTWVGILDNFTLERGSVKAEFTDLLKALDKIEIPAKVDIKLSINIDASIATIGLNDTEGLDAAPTYVRIGDELIYYTGLNATTNQLTGCTRGAIGTVAAAHAVNDKVSKIRYYPPANPFDILKEMLLTDGGLISDYVAAIIFDACRDFPGGEVDFSAIIVEPTPLDELYFEIVDLLDCKSWVGEDLKITIARNLPNYPGRNYSYFSDAANIIQGSPLVDLNAKSRISRVVLYWDKSILGDVDKPEDYNCLDISLDAAAESVNEYGEAAEQEIFCRWLQQGREVEEVMAQFIKDFTSRRVWTRREAQPLIDLDVELKDSAIKTGSFARLTTDEILQVDGNTLDNASFQVVKREFKGNRATLKFLGISPKRIGFIAPDGSPDYSGATIADKEYAFITDDLGQINGQPGYFLW